MRTVVPCSQSHCRGCPLEVYKGKRLGTEAIHSHGEGNSPVVDVLIINNYPNQTDDENGAIVMSKGGYELRNAMQSAGIHEIAYTNLVRCRPVDRNLSNRHATTEEQQSCANHVWQDIQRMKPKVVVTLGEAVTRALVPYVRWHKKSTQETAGETYVHNGVKFMPMPSPYDWAFDDNPYPHRKRLRSLSDLLKKVVDDKPTPFSLKGDAWYCGTIAEVKMAIKRIKLLDAANGQWGVGLDTEGQGLNRVAPNGLSCIQFSPNTKMGYIIPIDHHDSPWTPEERAIVIGLLRDLFLDATLKFICWVAHEAKFDLNVVLRHLGIKRLAKPMVDPIFLEFLDDENLRAKSEDDDGKGGDSFRSYFNLKALTLTHMNFRHYDPEILDIRVKPEGFWKLPMRAELYEGSQKILAEKYTDYCGMDGYEALRLAIDQRQALDRRGYTGAFNLASKWGSRCTHLRRTMEVNGIHIDRTLLDFLLGPHSPVTARLAEIPQEIWDTPEAQETNKKLVSVDPRTQGMTSLFGGTPRILDFTKKEHKVALLVDTCKLEPLEKKSQKKKSTKGEDHKLPAIDAKFFAKHEHHPIVQLLQEYGGLEKLRTSYINPMHGYLTDPQYEDNQFDGRLHPQFHDTRTLTGRLASSGPSVHQTTRGDTFAKKCVKSLIGAELGNVLIEGDYAQAEVRWWAQMSGDQDMADMFWRMYEIQQSYYKNPTAELRKKKELECDIHRQVAALMFGLDIADVSKDKRQAAKSIVFGAIYGQSSQALAQILKISAEEAGELQKKFIGRFTKAGPWLTWIEEEAIRLGYVDAPNGRRRHLGPLFAIDEGGTRRQARNSPIQAIASDVMVEAAYLQQCYNEDKNYDENKLVRIVNLVHDALVQEVKLDFDLILDIITSTSDHMMNGVVEVMQRDYGCKMIVPMVADFKIGLRWGHAIDWDQGEDLRELLAKLQAQTDRLRNGGEFWHIALEQGISGANKKLIQMEEEHTLVTDAAKVKDSMKKIERQRHHVKYLSGIPI